MSTIESLQLFLRKCPFNFPRNDAFLEPLCKIAIGHPGNIVPDQLSEGGVLDVSFIGPGSVDEIGEDLGFSVVTVQIVQAFHEDRVVHLLDLVPFGDQLGVVVDVLPGIVPESDQCLFDLFAV